MPPFPFRPLIAALLMLLVLSACDEARSGAVSPRPPAHLPDGAFWVFFQPADGADLSAAEALAARGFQVIARARDAGSDLDFEAVAIKELVRELLARGVKRDHIALVGRGAGGRLAMRASGLAQVPDSALVVFGACPREGAPGYPAYREILGLQVPTIKGRFLSLVGPGDGSCRAAQEAANGAASWETALGPGADWLDEAARWIREK